MINLLPPDIKKNYSFARRNVGLRRWVLFFLIAVLGLVGITTYGLLSLQQSQKQQRKEITSTETLFKQEKYDETQQQVKDIAGSFKLVVKVLGNEVLFSQLLKQLASIVPKNASLAGLTISQSQSALDITATTADYDTATQLQVNLADPANKLFSKADIISISCGTKDSGSAAATGSKYPCNVVIRALFAPNNPYLLVNQGTKK